MSKFNKKQQYLREKCESDFLFFCKLVFGEYNAGQPFLVNPYHHTASKALTDCWNGKCPRLIISMPPGFGKTTLAIYYVAWSLLKNPASNYIYISYSEGRCNMSSKYIRDILMLDAIKGIWGERIIPSESAKMWYVYRPENGKLKKSGTFRTAACDGQITGFDGGMMGKDASHGGVIIDDFMKEVDARYEAKRKKSYETFVRSIRTRLRDPRACMIIIMQRLHPLDLVGCLLDKQKGMTPKDPEYYKLIKIQAWDKKTKQPTFPGVVSKSRIDDLQRNQRFLFESQYQQEPENITNDFFNIKKIKREFAHKLEAGKFAGSLERGMEFIVRGWDFNYTTSTKSDWTTGIKLGIKDGIYYVLDIFRERAQVGDPTRDLKILFKQCVHNDMVASKWKKVAQSFPEDPGYSIATDFMRWILSEGGLCYKSRELVKKEVRWYPLANVVNSGNLVYVEYAGNQDNLESEQVRMSFFNELQSGPGGEYDDQIDALSRAFDYIQILQRRFRLGARSYGIPFVGAVYDG